MRFQAACALVGLALAGCVTTGQGDKMASDIAQLRQRLDVMEVRDRDINQKVGQLRTVLDEATALLGRNSADLGARMAKNETDIAAMTGKIEEAKYLVGELQKQVGQATTKVATIEQTQGQLLQNQQRIVDRVAPTMPEDKEALWKEAQKRLADGQRDDARRFLRSFIQRFPDDPRAPQGQLQVGISFVQELKHSNAVAEFSNLIQRFSRSPEVPEDKEALWKESQKRLADGQRDDARRFLRSFIQRFPDDPRAPQGQLQVGISFVQELKHSNAVAEFSNLIQRFSRSPEVPEAMWQLAESFVVLKFCSDAKAMYQDLAKRYPKSPRASQVKERLRNIQKIGRDKNLCTS